LWGGLLLVSWSTDHFVLLVAAVVQNVCMKIAHSVQLRMHTLQGVEAAINDDADRNQSAQKLSLEEIKALQPVLADLFVRSNSSSFPIQLQDYSARAPKPKESVEDAGRDQIV
jgi:hypothetical protein